MYNTQTDVHSTRYDLTRGLKNTLTLKRKDSLEKQNNVKKYYDGRSHRTIDGVILRKINTQNICQLE